MSEFSAKQKSLAIVPKPFAILSLIGSSYIIYHVLHNSKRRNAVQYQILLGLSLSDIIFSTAVSFFCIVSLSRTSGHIMWRTNIISINLYSPLQVFLGTWPIPAYVNDEKPTVYLASGTDREYIIILYYKCIAKHYHLTNTGCKHMFLQKHAMHTHSLYSGQS